jgi:hypothetical protein
MLVAFVIGLSYDMNHKLCNIIYIIIYNYINHDCILGLELPMSHVSTLYQIDIC